MLKSIHLKTAILALCFTVTAICSTATSQVLQPSYLGVVQYNPVGDFGPSDFLWLDFYETDEGPYSGWVQIGNEGEGPSVISDITWGHYWQIGSMVYCEFQTKTETVQMFFNLTANGGLKLVYLYHNNTLISSTGKFWPY